MKKLLMTIIACILLITLSAGAVYADLNFQNGFELEFNGELTGRTSVICNDTHFVPLRMLSEKMGAALFYRERDCQIIALARDGSLIYHVAGENTVTVNGEQMRFGNPSFSVNGETYIPIGAILKK